jgi:hypothetical protein
LQIVRFSACGRADFRTKVQEARRAGLPSQRYASVGSAMALMRPPAPFGPRACARRRGIGRAQPLSALRAPWRPLGPPWCTRPDQVYHARPYSFIPAKVALRCHNACQSGAVVQRRCRWRDRTTLVKILSGHIGHLRRGCEIDDRLSAFSGGYREELSEPSEARDQTPLSSAKRVATKPGCRQFAVTLVPCRLRASSRVNKMLQSFERL